MKPIIVFQLLLLPALLNCDLPNVIQSEYSALIALRRTLNSTLLNSSWNSLQCVFNLSSWQGIRCINNRVVSITLESIGLLCRMDDPFALSNLTELTLVSFKNNSISGTMFDFSFNPKITTIDMSMNKFNDHISNSLLNLNLLETLQLDHNKLSGPVPPLNQPSLKVFNVSYNELTGQIPTTSKLQWFNESSYTGNPQLCGHPSPSICPGLSGPESVANDHDSGSNMFSKSSVLIVVFVALQVIGLIAFLWVVFVLYKRRKRRISMGKTQETSEEANGNDDNNNKEKSEEKIKVISDAVQRKIVFFNGDGGFHIDDLLKASAESMGTGSFGACYKATLGDDRNIVVKRMKDVSPMTDEEFGSHIRALVAKEHSNLFPLLGYYCSSDEKLLVYNLALDGSLFDRIHGGRGENTRIPFKWSSRLSVAKHVARAMEFLHRTTKRGDEHSVPHGNLKSSNVLLESDEVALVSDYGLLPLIPALLAPKRMAAYHSPEYQNNRKICKKSDVWCYGCLLLELVTRKTPLNSQVRRMDGGELVGWVHRAVREEWTCEVFDAEIAMEKGAMQGMFRLLQVALWCCESSVSKRPDMMEV
ncbi:uncharacterized protein A4U43_C08F22080 [Asparagus officinalis]|nr:uncharacterized protein A4U43_C08F22080 [Asparagus officinalis]